MDEAAAALEAASAAERMGEGCIGREVFIDGLLLHSGRALGQAVDDVGNVLDWVVHAG